jgi:hypothetical protein
MAELMTGLPRGVGELRMSTGLLKTWLALSVDGARLAFETQQVIGLRLMKIAAGGAAAQAEVTRMITEKAFASAEAAATVATGGSARKVVRRYRTRVKANARRLSRRKQK